MRNLRDRLISSTTSLCLGLLLCLASCSAGTGQDPADTPRLLQVCKAASEYKKNEVSYSKGLEQSASIQFSRKLWLQLFPKRLVYSIPSLEIELYERDPKVPAGFDPEEETAFVLGRVRLSGETGCGLLVLEDGYYSSTRIVLYPVLASGTTGTGLELADYFADEEESVNVSSLFSMEQDLRITTKLVKSVGIAAGPPRGSKAPEPRVSESRFSWRFDSATGFVRVDQQPPQ